MVQINGTSITMTRGDTLQAKISIYNKDGSIYVPQNGDNVRFAVKRNYNDSDVLIYKDIPMETLILEINPDDTKSLTQPSSYVYDIQLTTADGRVDTFIAKAKFKITEEVD